jgi:hypothetical protein
VLRGLLSAGLLGAVGVASGAGGGGFAGHRARSAVSPAAGHLAAPSARSSSHPASSAPATTQAATPRGGTPRTIGDGSTADTGPQPHQLKPEKLQPGQAPPQFVVFSWDGALENDDHLFSRFREVAKANNAHMTFFLSGLYLLPDSKRTLYHPPMPLELCDWLDAQGPAVLARLRALDPGESPDWSTFLSRPTG